MNVNYEFGMVCELEGRRTFSHFGICLERLRKPAPNLREDSRCSIRYSNRVPPQWKHQRYHWNHFAWCEFVVKI
jgi:hypothetical protein